ncbi:hypothetical protein APED_25945 [Acanthopleuribacter pedis]
MKQIKRLAKKKLAIWEVKQAVFQWIRPQKGQKIQQVFRHNPQENKHF